MPTLPQRLQLCNMIPRLVGNRNGSPFIQFVQWIDSRIQAQGSYDYVLDGANIGFFGLGKEVKGKEKSKSLHEAKDSCFSFEQARGLTPRCSLTRDECGILIVKCLHTPSHPFHIPQHPS